MFERFKNKNKKETPETDGGRKDFERYKKWLHLDENELRGKILLDVGSANAQFGEFVEKAFPGTKVIRFDYFSRNQPHEQARIDFRADASHLPLKAESIDVALAMASITNNPGEDTLAALKELFEAVRVGGEIRVTPIWDASTGPSQERLRIIREYVEELEQKGEATAEWIPDGFEERIVPASGEKVRDTRYFLAIHKTASHRTPNALEG